jgi:hypothetical protein
VVRGRRVRRVNWTSEAASALSGSQWTAARAPTPQCAGPRGTAERWRRSGSRPGARRRAQPRVIEWEDDQITAEFPERSRIFDAMERADGRRGRISCSAAGLRPARAPPKGRECIGPERDLCVGPTAAGAGLSA